MGKAFPVIGKSPEKFPAGLSAYPFLRSRWSSELTLSEIRWSNDSSLGKFPAVRLKNRQNYK
jgi:hypothetical protein